MSTFLEQLAKDLEQNGLFQSQIDAVIPWIVEADPMISMRDRWNDDIDGYSEGFYNITFALSKSIVLEYIDETCPKAWFRPMFLPTAERDALLASWKEERIFRFSKKE